MKRLLIVAVIFLLLAWPAFAPAQHNITLAWTASTTPNVTYNVYRGTTTGGPYTKINTSPVSALTYADTTGNGGVTYFYVVTAMDAGGFESVNSNEASSTFLANPVPPAGVTAVAH